MGCFAGGTAPRMSLRLRGGRLSFPNTLARRRFRFACLHSRGDAWLFRLCVALAFFCLHFPAKRNLKLARARINGSRPFPKTTLFPERDRLDRPNGTSNSQGHGLTEADLFRKPRCSQKETVLSGQTEPQTRKGTD